MTGVSQSNGYSCLKLALEEREKTVWSRFHRQIYIKPAMMALNLLARHPSYVNLINFQSHSFINYEGQHCELFLYIVLSWWREELRNSSRVHHKWQTLAQVRGTAHKLPTSAFWANCSMRQFAFCLSHSNSDWIYSSLFSFVNPTILIYRSKTGSLWNLAEAVGREVMINETEGR